MARQHDLFWNENKALEAELYILDLLGDQTNPKEVRAFLKEYRKYHQRGYRGNLSSRSRSLLTKIEEAHALGKEEYRARVKRRAEAFAELEKSPIRRTLRIVEWMIWLIGAIAILRWIIDLLERFIF